MRAVFLLLACCACCQGQPPLQVLEPNTEIAIATRSSNLLAEPTALSIYIAETFPGPESCSELGDAGTEVSLLAGNRIVITLGNIAGVPIIGGSHPVLAPGAPAPNAFTTTALVDLILPDAGTEQVGASGTVVLTEIKPAVAGNYTVRIVEPDSGVFVGNLVGNFAASLCVPKQ